MYYLELGATDEALRLFDGPIFGARSSIVLELIDASALLWRLMLRGVDVGSRFEAMADKWSPIAAAGNYAFNDMHAMIAFVGAGRGREQQAVLEAQRAVLDGETHRRCRQPRVYARGRASGHTRNPGLRSGPLRGVRCVAAADPPRAHRFGGSHAQRDLLDQTLIEASRRAGFDELTTALVRERVALRPRTPLAALLDQRAQALGKAA